ncbi:MAG: citrate/2-methylcitrate synthase [Clostridiales bacterium]|nr:citrate/2-methylcitrate synthase [Clostridiales bacterium]
MNYQSNYLDDNMLKCLCEEFRNNNHIDPEAYTNFKVKRGLRDADGTGVVAGITLIGNVHGYVLNEGEKVPIEGKLTYRGIDVNDLVNGFITENRFGFEETAYLILIGELPNKNQLEKFTEVLGKTRILPPGFTEDMLLKAPSGNVMNKLARATLALYSYDDNADDISLENSIIQSIQLIARFPTIISLAYQVKKHYYDNDSLVLRNPDPNLSTAENILRLSKKYGEYTQDEARLLDLCMVLHAEHGGGNNSAFSCRVLSSSGTDTYSSISAAVGSLKGPKHGGASTKVSQMFDEIKQNVKDWTNDDEVASYIEKIINKEAGDGTGLVYGMGHAVYTLSDPRSVILKIYARKLAEKNGYLSEFELHESVERLTPEIFARVKGDTKTISANVDFYSGLVYKMLGLPEELYAPLFAASRIVGWTAHRIEEIQNGGRLIRPAYKMISKRRDFVPLSDRD